MVRKNKVIYSINIEDVQAVAMQEYERLLTDHELKIIEDKLGDYIDWHEAIVLALNDAVNSQEVQKKP